MHETVAFKLISDFRKELLSSYGQSGLQKHTMELINAVNGLVVIVGKKGIRLGLQAGKSKEFYARAGALNYGSVRGSATKGKARAKFKKVLTKSGTKTAGGVTVTKAFNFFKLSDAQVRSINDKYIAYFQEEVNKFLGGKGK